MDTNGSITVSDDATHVKSESVPSVGNLTEIGLVVIGGHHRVAVYVVDDTGHDRDLVSDARPERDAVVGHWLKTEDRALRDEEVAVRLNDFSPKHRAQTTEINLNAIENRREIAHIT